MQILNGWKLFTRLWKDFVFVDMTRTGTGKKTSGGSRDTPGRTPTRAHGSHSHRRGTSQPSKPTNPRPSGCGPNTVAGSREATGTALATAVAAAAVAAAALAAAALAIPALAAAAALRGAPHLRMGTAMAVAGAMPMVLAVDDSPLTQLNAELPSGAHSNPIGNL